MGAEGIALADELFGGVREVWDHFGDVVAEDVFPGGAPRMRRKTFSPVVQEEGSSS